MLEIDLHAEFHAGMDSMAGQLRDTSVDAIEAQPRILHTPVLPPCPFLPSSVAAPRNPAKAGYLRAPTPLGDPNAVAAQGASFRRLRGVDRRS